MPVSAVGAAFLGALSCSPTPTALPLPFPRCCPLLTCCPSTHRPWERAEFGCRPLVGGRVRAEARPLCGRVPRRVPEGQATRLSARGTGRGLGCCQEPSRPRGLDGVAVLLTESGVPAFPHSRVHGGFPGFQRACRGLFLREVTLKMAFPPCSVQRLYVPEILTS